MIHGVLSLLPKIRNILKSPAPKSYQINSLVSKKRVFRRLKKRKTHRLSAKLASIIVVASFLLGYQPNFTQFPPQRNTPVKAEAPQSQTITAQVAPIIFTLPHPGYISTYFSTYHPGIDIAAGLGMPIHPVAAGKIISTGFNFWGLGLVVEIDHGNGYKSLYAHMGKIYVKTGQIVSTNDLLGEVGLTGHTSGPHTHLELSRDGKNFNPVAVLPTLPDLASAWENSATPSNKLVAR